MIKRGDVMEHTIQEASKILDLSRMTVYKKIDKIDELNQHIVIKKGKKYITDKGIEIIKLSLENCKGVVTPNNELTTSLQDQIKYLKSEIETKNKHLEAKDKQLEAKDKQLESKDELLKNFQVLLGHEQQSKALLENKLNEVESNKKDLSLVEWLKNIFYKPEKI
jgi:chromosome segregation ATPase